MWLKAIVKFHILLSYTAEDKPIIAIKKREEAKHREF